MMGCYIGGKVTCQKVTEIGSGYTTPTLLNVYNLETESDGIDRTPNRLGIEIFNLTKAPHFSNDSTTKLIGVTDEQMKNPVYL